MKIALDLKNKKISLKKRLTLYMLVLLLIILIIIIIGLYFLKNFNSTEESLSKNLSFQLDVYQKQVETYFDKLEMMTNSLANNSLEIIESFFLNEKKEIIDINNNQNLIYKLENTILPKLKEETLKTDCSGGFILLNGTVNQKINKNVSKAGLYIQRSTIDASDENLLLLRGVSDIGRKNNIMPHRKWNLEFNTNNIPNYNETRMKENYLKNNNSYLSDIFTIEGTSERVMLLYHPIIGKDNTYYGICGFEISESYFKSNFSQTTQFNYLNCYLTKSQNSSKNPQNGFASGKDGGYFLNKESSLTSKVFHNSLMIYEGSRSYIGMKKEIILYHDPYTITLMIPKSDYDQDKFDNTMKLILFIFIFVSLSVTISIYFSNKFLKPIISNLDKIKNDEHKDVSSSITEIDDLISYLNEKDKLHEEENSNLQREYDEKNNELSLAQNEIARLSYSRKTEIDPEIYQMFKNGLKTLTKMERKIFLLYLEGKSNEEILEEFDIQMSTLKYHNHNIIGKLGVNSRKEMLRYATILKHEKENKK